MRFSFSTCVALTLVVVLSAGAAAQSSQAQSPPAKVRSFAPGVETVIPVEINPEETTAVHDIVEIRSQQQLDWQPQVISPSRTLYSKAESVRIRREVWQLQFAFKPLRMIWVDVPQPSGQMRRTLVWYLVYRVDNTNQSFTTAEVDGGFHDPKKKPAEPVRFIPHFVLEGHEVDAAGKKLYRAYLDRVIPAAMEPIRRRELPGRQLLDSTEMAEREIPVGSADDEQSVWGVAMWTNVDPQMDFFSVYIRGLTNAYRWVDPPGAYKPGDPAGAGRRFARKTLQLNFWRPGDEYLEHESEVRYGVAPSKADLYGVKPGVAYQWVYR